MQSEPGLRERKKQKTRKSISDAAFALFSERGFEQVTVSQVAAQAEVSEATVFNYFRSKEDLVYQGMTSTHEELIAAIQGRAAGTSALAAFGEFALRPLGVLASDEPAPFERIAVAGRIIAASPALQARERQILEQTTHALVEVLARETGAATDDVETWVVANAIVGAHGALVRYVRGQVIAGVRGVQLAERVRAQTRRALAVLDAGLAAYPASVAKSENH